MTTRRSIPTDASMATWRTLDSFQRFIILAIVISTVLFHVNVSILYHGVKEFDNPTVKMIPNHTTATTTTTVQTVATAPQSTTVTHSNPQHHNDNIINSSPPSIVVVGLPKSGTTSLYELFHCSGFFTSHYCCCGSNRTEYPCSTTTTATTIKKDAQSSRILSHAIQTNLQQAKSMFWNVGSYQVYTQLDGEPPANDATTTSTNTNTNTNNNNNNNNNNTNNNNNNNNHSKKNYYYILPQHDNLNELHRAAPNAIWILNLRPPADWARSVLGWLDLASRLDAQYNSNSSTTSSSTKDPVSTFTMHRNRNETRLKQFLMEFYQHHVQTIQQFVKAHPSHTLLQLDITSDDAASILEQSIPGVRAECWKRQNAGAFFQVQT